MVDSSQIQAASPQRWWTRADGTGGANGASGSAAAVAGGDDQGTFAEVMATAQQTRWASQQTPGPSTAAPRTSGSTDKTGGQKARGKDQDAAPEGQEKTADETAAPADETVAPAVVSGDQTVKKGDAKRAEAGAADAGQSVGQAVDPGATVVAVQGPLQQVGPPEVGSVKEVVAQAKTSGAEAKAHEASPVTPTRTGGKLKTGEPKNVTAVGQKIEPSLPPADEDRAQPAAKPIPLAHGEPPASQTPGDEVATTAGAAEADSAGDRPVVTPAAGLAGGREPSGSKLSRAFKESLASAGGSDDTVGATAPSVAGEVDSMLPGASAASPAPGAAAAAADGGSPRAAEATPSVPSDGASGALTVVGPLASGSAGVSGAESAGAAQETPGGRQEDTFEQIVLGLRGKLDSRNGRADIQMNPPSLGALHVSITLENGSLTAQFDTQSEMVRQLLTSHIDRLRNVLEGQGITVDRLAVRNVELPQTAPPAAVKSDSAGAANPDGRGSGQYGQTPQQGQRRSGGPGSFAAAWQEAQEPLDLVA